MIKSELIQRLKDRFPHLTMLDLERTVDTVFDDISSALARGDRVELRNFGTFTTRRRRARQGRNPRTGQAVAVPERAKAFFQTGRKLHKALNAEALEKLGE